MSCWEEKVSVAIYNTWCSFFFFFPPSLPPVTGMKMEAIPELRMETEDRQSTEYEVHHQKLVNKRAQTQTRAKMKVAEAATCMIYFSTHRQAERCICCHALAWAHVSTHMHAHRVGSTSRLRPPGWNPKVVSMETAMIMRVSCFVCRTPTRVKFCLTLSVFPGLARTVVRLWPRSAFTHSFNNLIQFCNTSTKPSNPNPRTLFFSPKGLKLLIPTFLLRITFFTFTFSIRTVRVSFNSTP